MFDTLTIARQLTEAGIQREHADAIAAGIREAAEHGDHVTPAMLDARLDAGLAKLRADGADPRSSHPSHRDACEAGRSGEGGGLTANDA